MSHKFHVTYKSGRKETLFKSARESARARKDLVAAADVGAVICFEEEWPEKNAGLFGRKVQKSFYILPEIKKAIQEKADLNKLTFSQYMAKLAKDHIENSILI